MKEWKTLEELFHLAFEKEELQSIFFYELLHHNVFILGKSENGKSVLQDGEALRLVSIIHEGVSYFPLFLSKEAMEIFLENKKEKYIEANGEDILETLKKGNIVINPGMKDSMVLMKDEIQTIISQGKN